MVPVWYSSVKMTTFSIGMLPRAPLVALSRQRRTPTKMPSNGYPPFHHGPQVSSSATENHWFRPSATLTQLIRLSSNHPLQRQFSPCRNQSIACGRLVTLANRVTNKLTTKLHWILQRFIPTTLSSAVPIAPLPSNTSGWRRHTRLSLMSRSKRLFPRLTWLASAVVITLLFDAGGIWLESPRIPSADCVLRKLNLQNIYGYDVRRSWWNDIMVTLAIRWTNSSAFYVQL